MSFRESPGQFLAGVLRTAFRATAGLTILVWSVFLLWLSWELARSLASYLGRTIFSRPW